MDLPRFKAHLSPVTTQDGQVFLLSESNHWLVGGAIESAVVPYMDGRTSIPEIASALSGSHSLFDVLKAINKFQRLGLLASGWPAMDPQQVAYWEALGADPKAVAGRMAERTVRVSAVGEASSDGLVELLRNSGVRAVGATDPTPSEVYLEVVVVDDYLNSDLEKINAGFVEREQAWMLVKSIGYWAWLGPVMIPPRTGCWKCLEQRLDANRMVDQYLRRFGAVVPPSTSKAALPATVGVIENMAAAAVARAVATDEMGDLTGRLIALDVRGCEASRHELIKQPQCPACGDPSMMRSGAEIALTAEPVRFAEDGGFRIQSPEQTFARLEKHVSPILGAVSWLEPLYGSNNGLSYSYSAGHNFAMVRNNMSVLRKNLRGNSGGKGRTEIQAKVSGICEAIERYSGVWSPDRPVLRARSDELDGRVILPNDLMLFSEEQFDGRLEWNSQASNRLHIVPERFRQDSVIDWTESWSLSREERVYVPSAYVWFGHPDSSSRFFTYSDGNGNASGNSIEEAILQGFLELVERDAVGIWWYNRLRRPGVDLDSFEEAYFGQLQEFYARMNRSLWMIDLTTDLDVPTFAAVSHRLDSSSQDILVAFGAHLEPRLAALRALTELNQFLPAIDQRDGQGNTVYMEEDPATLHWWRTGRMEENEWLRPDDQEPPRRRDDFVFEERESLSDYVQRALDLAAAAGLEVLAVDQSRPDLDLSVAKVMAPGIRHFWRRLAPGRLFDLPVEMGWSLKPTAIAELNPISVFF